MKHIPGLLVYLGIGALLHAVLLGSHFDWQSVVAWGVVLGWPIMAVAVFGLVMLVIFLIALIFDR